jgi:hypothetical protein
MGRKIRGVYRKIALLKQEQHLHQVFPWTRFDLSPSFRFGAALPLAVWVHYEEPPFIRSVAEISAGNDESDLSVALGS